ncbi:MAG TPA: S8 family serine peptidase [Pseudonocardiaceae bacterium]|nr:S8 family serine peptidase [Pseudonocardiaceae bacterium]
MKQSKALAAGTAFAVSAALAIGAAGPATAGTTGTGPQPLTPQVIAQLAEGPKQPVIVVLRDQHATTAQNTGNRAAANLSAQRQLVAQARQAGATHVTQFSVINGFAATVTATESSYLASSPQVAQVVPDLPIRLADVPTVPTAPTPTKTTPTKTTPKPNPAVCSADPRKPLLEPEALQTTHDAYTDPKTPQAQQLATGKGVKVAFLADGIDTNNPDFVRADGSHVFADYRDFTGEGTNTPNDDREAFGDASAIAAQGKQTYDLSTFVSPSNPLPKNCDIRILGMAPGASLVGLKVIASTGFGSTSGVVQAIDYAVNVDHVNVINESLGANPYPDNGTDPFTLANNAAVAAGITVVNSSGDAGYGNTVDSPASDPRIISTGASTTYQLMAQTWDSLPGFSGKWANDNVSAISSSGITQSGRVYDLIAPGDLGWALCSTDTTVHLGCTNYLGKPSPIQAFGGTSQAAPLTAGAAALVIEAYTATHNGVKPTPALVKQILTSTATDTYDPAQRQGAGLLDALAAVQAAKSISDGNGAPKAQGNGLLFGQSQLGATAAPNSPRHFDLTVTNVGATTQTVTGHGRGLTRTLSDQQGSVALDTTAPSNMLSRGGSPDNSVTKTFTVGQGADHLDASIAWSDPNGDPATLVLLDPKGAFAGYSMPQTSVGPDFGHVDVHSPMPGTWTALIYFPHTTSGFDGQVNYEFTTTRYAKVGTVTGSLTLPPGHTGTLQVNASTPAQPGDLAATVEVDTAARQRFAVPLVLRSLVPTSGTFTGVLTGGNGRPGAPAQTNTFKFDVPTGKKDVDVNVTLQGNVSQGVLGYLVSPDGQVVSQATNVRAVDENGTPSEFSRSLQGYKRDPLPGRWTYVVVFQNAVSGAATREPFAGQVRFNLVDMTADHMPAKATLPQGKPATVTVHVHNTGAVTGSFYVDARTSKWTDAQLMPNQSAANVPLTPSATMGYLVPPDTQQVTGITSGTVPVSADLTPNTGAPERLGPPGPGNIAVVSDSSPAISQGLWLLEADPIGPFPAANTGMANFAAVAHTQSFDTAATASTGDYWLASVLGQPPAFHPVTVDPGETGTVTVTFKPNAPKGTVVTGWLYVDDTSLSNNAGDELAALPYSYTVG